MFDEAPKAHLCSLGKFRCEYFFVSPVFKRARGLLQHDLTLVALKEETDTFCGVEIVVTSLIRIEKNEASMNPKLWYE